MVVMVWLLFKRFGSRVSDVTVAVLVTLPPPATFTCTTRVIVADPDAGSVPSIQRTVPFPPTVSGVQLEVTDWKVVFGGSGSLTCTLLAGFEPRLVTVIV